MPWLLLRKYVAHARRTTPHYVVDRRLLVILNGGCRAAGVKNPLPPAVVQIRKTPLSREKLRVRPATTYGVQPVRTHFFK